MSDLLIAIEDIGLGAVVLNTADRLLPVGAKMMTLECGMRFLTDYLAGDTYFRVHREGHNLDRARNQFRLVASMEEHWDEMNAIIARLANA